MLSTRAGLEKDLFLPSDFTAKAFVEKRLSQAANGDEDTKLASIVQDLQATVQDLTDELLNLIDRDHQTFLELSGDLLRVDATVGSLRGPLVHLREKVDAVRKSAAGPTEAIKDFDSRLLAIREKKKQLQQGILARSLRQSIEKDLINGGENRGAQKLALMTRMLPETEYTDVRRELEHRLSERLWEQPIAVIKERLRSLVVLGSIEAARRVVTADLSTLEQETVLERVLARHHQLLQACSEEGLGAIFEFPSQAILPAATLSAGKLISSSEARKAEALRRLLAHMSPTGTPHAPLRWNPRMHSELRFQDAVNTLEKSPSVSSLDLALQVLYSEDDPNRLAENPILASHLFRMACRLVLGFISHMEASAQSEGHLVVERVKEAFQLTSKIRTNGFLKPPPGWDKSQECILTMAERSSKCGMDALKALQTTLIESCDNEAKALDRAITTAYRMTRRPLSTTPSPTVSNVLEPLRLILDQLDGVVPSGLDQWTMETLREIKDRLASVADKLIKREVSLVRYNQRSAKSGVSDSYKIAKQMAMDAEAFTRQAEEIMEKRFHFTAFPKEEFAEIARVTHEFADSAAAPSAAADRTPPGGVPPPSETASPEPVAADEDQNRSQFESE